MDEVRERMLEMANKAESSEQPLSWFEDLYRFSNRDREQIPWDWKEPHPFLIEWSNENEASGKALVVGSGLGEDAAFLYEKGWQVTAFDFSESAVDWARNLHQGDDIDWTVGDLLNPKESWFGGFDLVLEVHILQAIPEEVRKKAFRNLAPMLARGGTLVCIGRLGEDSEGVENGPPWPLTEEFIIQIGEGLEEIELHSATIPGKEGKRYRAVWKNTLKIHQHNSK
jgi:SAM-dependent methyltransferase